MEVIIIILSLVPCIIFGFATDSVIRNKGYYENWFWWGFFFGILAFVVACAKPQNTYVSNYEINLQQNHENNTLSGSGWKCECGRTHAAYVSSCTCGKSKKEVMAPVQQKKMETHKAESMDEVSKAAAIKEYKELADAGIITQEEFEAKKAQLLGL